MGVVDAEVVNAVMAKKLGIPFVNLKNFRIPPGVLKRVPAAAAHRFQTVPVAEAENALVVAVENPMDMAKLEGLRFVVGVKLLPVMASGDDIVAALERNYGPTPGANGAANAAAAVKKTPDVGIGELTHRLSAETADADLDEQQSAAQDSTLVQLVNKMIVDAIEQKASDIHIEANAAGRDMRVRFRKDGALVAVSRAAVEVPQGGGVAHQDHVPARHHRAQEAAGRQDRVPPLRAARRRPARRHRAHRRRPRGRGDARARRGDAGADRRSSASTRRRSRASSA